MLSIKATIEPEGDVFVIRVGEHELGIAKHRFDADLHANVINNALKKAYLDGMRELLPYPEWDRKPL